MIYQIIRGNVTPVTWAFSGDERQIVLDLRNASGDHFQLPIVGADLAENIVSSSINVYIVDQCQWRPEVIINDGADILSSMDCKIQVTAYPDQPFDFMMPLQSSFVIMYPEPPTPLTTFRDQHVTAGTPRFHQRPDGSDYYNSYDWYLAPADMDIVTSAAVGPALKTFPEFYEPHQKSIWIEFIRQPQSIRSYWRKAYSQQTARTYHPTLAKIDVKDGYMGTFYPIQWHLSKSEYAAALRSGYLTVHCFVMDVLGNCSLVASDTIGVNPPVSRYYPAEDINLRRRVQRYRGPRESWKQIAFGDETTYSINRVLHNAVDQFQDNIESTSSELDAGFKNLVISLQHTRAQRGII